MYITLLVSIYCFTINIGNIDIIIDNSIRNIPFMIYDIILYNIIPQIILYMAYYNKYLKYKKKYLDLKYKNIGCDEIPGKLYDHLKSMFEENTIYKNINSDTNYHIKKMLNCSINQVINSGILSDVKVNDNQKIILIDGTNLMRNKWFIMFSLVIADNKYKKYIYESIMKYVTMNKSKIIFGDEIKWLRHVIIKMISQISSDHSNNTYILCIQKFDEDIYKKYDINGNTLHWLPIDCFSYINGEQILCVRDNTFGFKNEADDYALILMYLFFKSNLNIHDVYIFSGDNYDWFTGKRPFRMSIYITGFIDDETNKNIFTYKLGFQNTGKKVIEVVSYKLYYNNDVYDDELNSFDDYYRYIYHYLSMISQ